MVLALAVATMSASARPAWAASGRTGGAAGGGQASAAQAALQQPDESSALAEARRSGRRVEVTGLRGERRQVFANPGGTLTLEQHTQPVLVRRGSGFVPVDTTLEARADGTVAPRAAVLDVTLSGGGSAPLAPLASLAQGGRRLSLGWPGPLPRPALHADTATYPEVLPGVDLEVHVQAQGFSEVLVVKTPEAARSPALAKVRFTLAGEGVSVRADELGNLRALDAGGRPVFSSPAPRMWDSSDSQASSPHPGEGGRQAAMGVELGAGELTIVPDQAMLRDPGTRFPVYLDPSFSGGENAWTSVWKKFPTTSYWNATQISSSDSTEGVVRSGFEAEQGNTVRSFFLMNNTPVNGKHILRAVFRITESWSWSCSARPVELWWTGVINSSTTWNTQPSWMSRVATLNVAKGYEPQGCGDGSIEFDMTGLMAKAAAEGWNGMTLGLRASNESDTFGWKRFRNDPVVAVDYNTVPAVPTSLGTTNPDLGCVTGAGRPYTSTTTPTLKALLHDDDAGQVLSARFEWAVTGIPDPLLGSATVGNVPRDTVAQTKVPAGEFADGGTYSWRVFASDGIDSSPGFGGWCEFTVDSTAPSAKPAVTSSVYPEDLVNFHGGVGVTAPFTFDPAGVADVAGYDWSWSTLPVTATGAPMVSAPSVGAPVTVQLTPPPPVPQDPTAGGQLVLQVRSVDRANNRGPIRDYSFLVGSAPAEVGHWTADAGAGTTLADSSGFNHPAAMSSGASWAAGRLLGRSALHLNGSSGAATTSGPVLRTDQSFTVSAWVRLTATNSFWRTAVAQEGTRSSGFFLQYSLDENRWALSMVSADADNPPVTRAMSTTVPKLNVWTHLAGVYDAGGREIRLYVNGVLEGRAGWTTPWNAAGALVIGRSRYNGGPSDWWFGEVTDVRVWQRVATGAEIRPMATNLVGQWDLDDGFGPVASDSAGGHDATMTSGATWTTGNDGAGAVHLDGSTGYLSTGVPVVRTDQSYTVSAWVRPSGLGNYPTVVSQCGTNRCAFYLQYDQGLNRWAMVLPSADVYPPAAYYKAMSTAAPTLNAWVHLVGVYDAAAGEVRLYVNGQLQDTKTGVPALWHAPGTVYIGRADTGVTVSGDVDNVKVFAGALNATEVASLA